MTNEKEPDRHWVAGVTIQFQTPFVMNEIKHPQLEFTVDVHGTRQDLISAIYAQVEGWDTALQDQANRREAMDREAEVLKEQSIKDKELRAKRKEGFRKLQRGLIKVEEALELGVIHAHDDGTAGLGPECLGGVEHATWSLVDEEGVSTGEARNVRFTPHDSPHWTAPWFRAPAGWSPPKSAAEQHKLVQDTEAYDAALVAMSDDELRAEYAKRNPNDTAGFNDPRDALQFRLMGMPWAQGFRWGDDNPPVAGMGRVRETRDVDPPTAVDHPQPVEGAMAKTFGPGFDIRQPSDTEAWKKAEADERPVATQLDQDVITALCREFPDDYNRTLEELGQGDLEEEFRRRFPDENEMPGLRKELLRRLKFDVSDSPNDIKHDVHRLMYGLSIRDHDLKLHNTMGCWRLPEGARDRQTDAHDPHTYGVQNCRICPGLNTIIDTDWVARGLESFDMAELMDEGALRFPNRMAAHDGPWTKDELVDMLSTETKDIAPPEKKPLPDRPQA